MRLHLGHRTAAHPSCCVLLAAAHVHRVHSHSAHEERDVQGATGLFLLALAVLRLIFCLWFDVLQFTLDTNRMPPPLPALFEDMFQQPGVCLRMLLPVAAAALLVVVHPSRCCVLVLGSAGITEDAIQRITSSSANMLSFQYLNGADAAILVSKSAGRYRIQSGSLEALWLVSSELVRRLQEHFASSEKPGKAGAGGGKESEDPFTILYQEPLPLADFFGCIDDHFEVRSPAC